MLEQFIAELDINTEGATSIRYSDKLIEHGEADPKTLGILIGESAFGTRALLHSTIEHELYHVQEQFLRGDSSDRNRLVRELKVFEYILENRGKYGFSDNELSLEVGKRNYYYFLIFGRPYDAP